MPLAEAREQHHVWVFYRPDSGAVLQVRYREPRAVELPKPESGVEMMETTLSEMACQQVHQLVVHGGRVCVRGALTRRR